MIEVIMFIFLAVCAVGMIGALVWIGIAEHINDKKNTFPQAYGKGKTYRWEECPFPMKS